MGHVFLKQCLCNEIFLFKNCSHWILNISYFRQFPAAAALQYMLEMSFDLDIIIVLKYFFLSVKGSYGTNTTIYATRQDISLGTICEWRMIHWTGKYFLFCILWIICPGLIGLTGASSNRIAVSLSFCYSLHLSACLSVMSSHLHIKCNILKVCIDI